MPTYGYVLIAVAAAIVAIVAFVSTRSDCFRVTRSAQMAVPASVIFPLINDLHEWKNWSPYEKLDPNLQKTFEGPSVGPGSSYIWKGNKRAGEGRSTITESKPNEFVDLKLQFIKPFASTCQVKFTLVPTAGGTNVSWILDGSNNLMGKLMSLVMNMDTMIGKDFEEGLANLDRVAQRRPVTH